MSSSTASKGSRRALRVEHAGFPPSHARAETLRHLRTRKLSGGVRCVPPASKSHAVPHDTHVRLPLADAERLGDCRRRTASELDTETVAAMT
jgi:hypothetical protein